MKITKLLYIATLAIGLLSSCAYTGKNLVHGGFYILGIDYLYCTSPITCIHEQGHRLDKQHGSISLTNDFAVSVSLFAIQHPNHNWSKLILAHDTPWHEVYAQMYGAVNGNIDLIPAELQRFYR